MSSVKNLCVLQLVITNHHSFLRPAIKKKINIYYMLNSGFGVLIIFLFLFNPYTSSWTAGITPIL